jgi:hypothetical protein
MKSLAIYPKFSSIAFLDFELQQKRCQNQIEFSFKIYKSKLWSSFCKSCRSTLTETNKIEFAFFLIFCEFLGIF